MARLDCRIVAKTRKEFAKALRELADEIETGHDNNSSIITSTGFDITFDFIDTCDVHADCDKILKKIP